MKALKEIAAENNIVLKLEEASTSTEVSKPAINHKNNKKRKNHVLIKLMIYAGSNKYAGNIRC